jgi:phage major head subunit gpT-like protein
MPIQGQAGIAVTPNYRQTLSRDYHKVFFDEYQRHEPQFPEVFNVTTHSEHQYKEGQLAGLTAAQQIAEGGPIPIATPVQGNEKEVKFPQYGLGFQLTQIQMEDDLTGHFRRMPTELGKALAYTREILAWDIFNSGFTDVRFGIDGKRLFANNHTTLVSEDTINNVGSASLSRTSLQAALDHFETMINENGVPTKMTPKLLIIPPQLRWKAAELMLSEYKPETADNDINSLKVHAGGLQYKVVHYLTSTTAWFVAADDPIEPRFIWRRQATFRDWDDPNTGNAIFAGTMRFKPSFWDYRWGWGSTGA